MIFVVFFGEAKTEVDKWPGSAMRIPLVILAILSLVAGFLEMPRSLGNVAFFSQFISTALPPVPETGEGMGAEHILQILAIAASLGGIALASLLFLGRRQFVEGLARTEPGGAVHRFWFSGWGFDWLYDALLVRPFLWLAEVNRGDILDAPSRGVAQASLWSYRALRSSQTGQLRWYAAAIAAVAVLIVAIGLLL